ncbi:MAG: sel1 repeat family protein [Rhodospirillales bacterium]|nr:sel1 repeat family protein [Rhodospirillales bacterium]
MSKPIDSFTCRALAAVACALMVAFASPSSAGEVPETYGEAMAWYREEAAAGNAEAQFLLAYALESGVHAAAAPAEARHWYTEAAEQGHAMAQVRLAMMLLEGRGGAADPDLARRYLLDAADAGSTDAMSILGYILASSEPADPESAYRWFSLAARAGDPIAAANLAALSQAMSDDQRAAAQQAFEDWLATSRGQ